jgi:hypothetical protein
MGSEGVFHLSKGNWKSLKGLFLSIYFMIKAALE